jgi:hypothetical protein
MGAESVRWESIDQMWPISFLLTWVLEIEEAFILCSVIETHCAWKKKKKTSNMLTRVRVVALGDCLESSALILSNLKKRIKCQKRNGACQRNGVCLVLIN